jgi:DNA-binding NtrC family response regulator
VIRVLLVEDEVRVAESLEAPFRARGMETVVCETAEDALAAPPCDVVLADLGLSGVDLLRRLKERDRALPILVLTEPGAVGDAVTAMRAGALDFLSRPVEPDVIVERVCKAVERGRIEKERDRLRGTAEIVAVSEGMKEVLGLARQVAAQDSSVLLTGESGTGKERVAIYLHEQSPRRVGPLVKVNCAAVPASLFEAEFFGHQRGAFTGADRDRPGWFAEADGGTLFLDEVGALRPEGQAKLLRTLETGEVRPVGAVRTRRVDVRVIAATNEDLAARRDAGDFRSDLYYRLAVFPIAVPPLRERPEDLAVLAERFAAPLRLAPDALDALRRHAWPGNVRELRNVIARARIVANGDRIGAGHLEAFVLPATDDLDLKRRVRALERDLFREALRRTGGKKCDAARLLGIDASNWAYHAKRLNLQ